MNRQSYLALLFFIVIRCQIGLCAQIETGWLHGKVTDKLSGSAIVDVEIRILDGARTELQGTKTDDSGEFLLAGIPPGEYELIFRKPDFPEYTTRATVSAGCGSPIAGQMETRKSQAQTTVAAEWQ